VPVPLARLQGVLRQQLAEAAGQQLLTDFRGCLHNRIPDLGIEHALLHVDLHPTIRARAGRRQL
jgi:hypothetical protein